MYLITYSVKGIIVDAIIPAINDADAKKQADKRGIFISAICLSWSEILPL